MTRVLQVSPFAIPDAPESGGLIRIAETRRAYERAGCEVITACVVTRKRDLRSDFDLQLPWLDRIWRHHIGKPKNLGPIRLRWATVRSQTLTTQLARKVTGAVDIIHIEHPWAIRLARELRNHPAFRDALLVYGSHNIEHKLHQSIWKNTHQWNGNAQRLHQQILAAERECALEADLCWAVSQSDASALTDELRAPRVIVAPSGCRPFPPRMALPEIPQRPYVLFVGGAYPPNIEGFLEWCGTSLDYLPANATMAIAGAAGERLAAMPGYREYLENGSLVNYGRVPQGLLDQLILNSHAVLLPISVGGGTNLKTAEALRSRRPLIATQASMRGFEAWATERNVYISNSVSDFRSAVAGCLARPQAPDSDSDTLDKLSWEHSLDEAVRSTLSAQRALSAGRVEAP